MTNKIIKNKRAQTEPNQCDWQTNFPPRINNSNGQNYINVSKEIK